MRARLALLVAVACLLGACGGDDNSSQGTSEPIESAATTEATPSPTPTPEPDKDDDGVPDADDYAPGNAKIQTEAQADDCAVLGIDFEGRKEGACEEESGIQVKVVNRDSVLSLKQIRVTLNSAGFTDTIPQEFDSPLVGGFVVCNVSVTNKLDAPVQINAPDLFGLLLGKRQFSADFDAMNTGDSELIYEDMQPGETKTGDVVFRVRPKDAAKLDRNGNLRVLQFSDGDGFGERPKQRVGIIRTYQ